MSKWGKKPDPIPWWADGSQPPLTKPERKPFWKVHHEPKTQIISFVVEYETSDRTDGDVLKLVRTLEKELQTYVSDPEGLRVRVARNAEINVVENGEETMAIDAYALDKVEL